MGVVVGVAAGGVGVYVRVAEGAISVGMDGFVGPGFGGSFPGEGSTSTLATTLASGDGVSAI